MLSELIFNREYELSELVSFIGEKIESERVTLETYISTDNMLVDRGGVEPATKLPSASRFNHFKNGDTLFSNIRTYFRKVWLADFEGGASADVLIFRSNDDKVLDPNYLYFLLSNEDFVNYTVLTAKGAKMPRGDKAAIMQYKFFLPKIDKQREIGLSLLGINKKIELNRQTNQTLEHMAQAIFKSWFVDFEPTRAKIAAKEEWAKRSMTTKAGGSDNNIKESQAEATFVERAAMAAISGRAIDSTNDSETGALAGLDQLNPEQIQQLKTTAALFPDTLVDSELGEIPEGWEVESMKAFGETTDYVANGSFASLKENVSYVDDGYAIVVRLTDYKAGWSGEFNYVDENGYKFLKKSSIQIGDVVISNVGAYAGTVFRVPDLEQPMTLGPNSILIKSDLARLYLFYHFTSHFGKHQLDGIKGGSAQPKFNKTDFRSLKFLKPNDDILIEFNKNINTVERMCFNNDKSCKKLSELRDSLLPKLLSGELAISTKEF